MNNALLCDCARRSVSLAGGGKKQPLPVAIFEFQLTLTSRIFLSFNWASSPRLRPYNYTHSRKSL